MKMEVVIHALYIGRLEGALEVCKIIPYLKITRFVVQPVSNHLKNKEEIELLICHA
ncbi:MAG: hypothetical protein KGH71_06185 [Candidatus Micrarchaeota archaeon]|nr:hypothetical protein [Candidatus Micrarchaeota archaeon]